MRSHLLTVVAGSARSGRCRGCRAGIVWATVVTRTRGAKSLPFREEPIVKYPYQDERTGVRYERWPAELLHLARQCGGRRQPEAR